MEPAAGRPGNTFHVSPPFSVVSKTPKLKFELLAFCSTIQPCLASAKVTYPRPLSGKLSGSMFGSIMCTIDQLAPLELVIATSKRNGPPPSPLRERRTQPLEAFKKKVDAMRSVEPMDGVMSVQLCPELSVKNR
jgi:hypothetical protein